MVSIAGFGVGLREIEYLIVILFLSFLALNVFVLFPENVFTAIDKTGEVFFPSGEEIAYTAGAFTEALSTNDIVGMVYGIISGSLSALVLVIKGIISIGFVFIIVIEGLIPFYNFINSW